MTVQRSPLSWPAGWPRATTRHRAKFAKVSSTTYGQPGHTYTARSSDRVTVAGGLDRLLAELRRLGVGDPLISTNLRLRVDGLPRSDQGEPRDPGVAVYFEFQGKDTVLACDKWDRVADNLVALALHIEAMRGMDRWGVGSLKQAFAGYAALPEQAGASSWRAVLGLSDNGNVALEDAEAAYRRLARTAHPDTGGSHEAMAALNQARDDARRELGA